MLVTASWGGAEVVVEVDAECRSVAALKRCLEKALPELDVEVVRLEVDGRSIDDESVRGLSEGSVIDVLLAPAALATATLREEGIVASYGEFCRAAEAGDVRLCRLFLDVGVSLEPGDPQGFPQGSGLHPLHAAAGRGHRELLKLLLESSCPKDCQNYRGNAALHFALAVHSADSEICKLLIEAGCATNVQNKDGNTPLHTAACRRNVRHCELLIEAGSATDVQNNDGNTALHFAASRGCEPLCKVLIEAGCAIDVKNDKGETPLHVALKQPRTAAVAKLFLDSGATPVEPKSSTADCCALC